MAYDTELGPDEEQAFQAWKQSVAPNDSGEDYDFRGAFKAGLKPAVNNHWPDTFKKPNHPTFSNESRYAGTDPDQAGSWDGDTFIPGARKQASEAREAGASRVARAVTKKTPTGMLPSIADDASYEALEPGTSFLDPKGERRKKPWNVASDADFERVPEGEQFLDPKGNLRQKPKYEGVDFTAQTLYNMSTNDKERARALERSYPGKVKTLEGVEGGKQFYIDDGGVLRKPKGFTDSPKALAASLTGAAAPTAGAIGGEIAGGIAGAGAAGIGAFPGAVMGGFAGGAAGQGVNDILLKWLGIHDRSLTEEIESVGISGLVSGAGSLVGRGLGALAPAAKETVKKGAPSVAASVLGADPERLATAKGIAEKGEHESSSSILRTLGMTDPGTEVPAAGWAMEAPHLHNVEAWEEAFHTQKPLLQSILNKHDKDAGELLQHLGLEKPGSTVKSTAAPDPTIAGQALKDRVLREAVDADAGLARELEKRKAAAQSGLSEKMGENKATLKAAEEAQAKGRQVLEMALNDMQQDVNRAMKVAQAGSNSGDLWWTASEKLQAIRAAGIAKHHQWYEQVYAAGGTHVPDSAGLPDVAERFLAQLPEGFESLYPRITQSLRDMGGVPDPANPGAWLREPVQPNLVQLHQLRSALRNNVDWYKINTDFKDGPYKFLAARVDQALHAETAAVPTVAGASLSREQSLSLASQLLDATDRSYGETMRIFNATEIKTVMNGLRAGEAPDPKKLLSSLYREGKTDMTAKLQDMLGPTLTKALASVDKQEILDAAKTFDPGRRDLTKVASEILDRHQSGMLEVVHGKQAADEMYRLGQAIHTLEGKIDIPVRPDDTLLDTMRKAALAGEIAQTAAKQNPLKTLEREMRGIEAEHKRAVSALQAARKSEPVGFLYDETVGAAAAANRILDHEDLIIATSAKFGNDSPEFKLLQQLAAQRILQKSTNPKDAFGKWSEQTQRLIFPGTTYDQMQLLVKEMDFLLSSHGAKEGVSMGMAALSKVEHPWASIVGRGGKLSKIITAPLSYIPGANPGGRALLGGYYGLVRKVLSSPSTMRWVEKGLRGDEAARQMVRAEIQRWMQVGGALGAGAAEAEYQTP